MEHHPPEDVLNDFGFFAISESLLPDSPSNSGQRVESGDDVLVVGYPRGLYIQENLYPYIKSASISSKWGSNFDGFPWFIIDRSFVGGSSGSLVITRPVSIISSNGTKPNDAKQYMFLGIYAAEATSKYHITDSGIVWYGNLIKDIILNGVRKAS
jgi:hypothetical protein